MYQLGYAIGYLIGIVGVLIGFGLVVSFLLLPLITIFFPDKLFIYWKKRLGSILTWSFTTLPVEKEENQEQKEDKDNHDKKQEKEDYVLIRVAGIPIEVPRSALSGNRPLVH